MYFFDPIPLGPEPLEELVGNGTPAAILLTSGNHLRAAEAYRRQFSVPIYAHADAREALGIKLDGEFLHTSSSELSVFEIIPLSGGPAGESAIFAAVGGGIMIMGDALINLPPQGFSVLPDKYCEDAKELRASLEELLEYPFDKMLFAHGTPIMTSGRRKLETLLAENA